MKYLLSLILLSTLLYFSACQKPDSEIPIFKVDPTNAQKGELSKYVDHIAYITLEAPPDRPFGNIGAVIALDDGYLIFDNSTNCLSKYNLDGQFQNVFGHHGKGPGEFVRISDFTVDEKSDIVTILDNYGKRILDYSLVDGSFLNSDKLNFLPCKIIRLGRNKLMSYQIFSPHPSQTEESTAHNLIVFSSPESIDHGYLSFNVSEILPRYSTNVFTKKGAVTYFISPYHDEVYSITQKSCDPLLKLDFGSYQFNKEALASGKTPGQKADIMYKTDMIYHKTMFYDFDDFYYFSFAWKGRIMYAYADKESQMTEVFNNYSNDIDKMPVAFFTGFSPGKMYYIIDSRFSSVGENDDPVLAIYTMK